MLIAYANIARLEATGARLPGIIRWRYCKKIWAEGKATLPVRGPGVGDTPSPLDAVLYGPSLRRLDLLGQYGQLHTCCRDGALIAEELDKVLGRLDACAALTDATTVQRSMVMRWAAP